MQPYPEPEIESEQKSDVNGSNYSQSTTSTDETDQPTGEQYLEDNFAPSVNVNARGETDIEFFIQPDPLYYIIKSEPVTITCQAIGASLITFSCNDDNVPQSMVQYVVSNLAR